MVHSQAFMPAAIVLFLTTAAALITACTEQGPEEPARSPAAIESAIAELDRQLDDLADEATWERGRLDRQIDELRIELATLGELDYSKIAYPSTDGLPIPAYLFRPLEPAPARVPAIIYAHGGEHGRFQSRSLKYVKTFVQRGYVVLAPNYRSSSGYSREFYEAADYGGLEIDDMLAARDFLAGSPDVDAGRIAILGLSHGGYNALMALIRAPGKFAAAVDFFGPTDLVWRVTATPDENPNTEPGDHEKFARMVGKTLDEAPDLYHARSPRFLADLIDEPVLILHGNKDSVVLLQESEWLAEAFEQAGKQNFAFHVIEGGQHGYPMQAMDAAWRLAYEFLDETLRTGPAQRPDKTGPPSAR
jgi:dipeptidyl aminopeptidase/acylaminoacyl peptidase